MKSLRLKHRRSYFEWFQNLHHQHWTEKQANLKLKEKMEKAFGEVWRLHVSQKVDLRTAAYRVALERILKVRPYWGE